MSASKLSKKCDFTLALHDPDQISRLKQEIFDFDIWAFIDHLPDSENGSNHTHFYIHLKQPVSISNLSEKLDIPENFIEWVRNKTHFIQYMIHKNSEDKIKYSSTDIISNDPEYINKYLNTSLGTDVFAEFDDLRSLSTGVITPYKYIQAHSSSLKNLSFYSRQLFLIRLLNLAQLGEENRTKYIS